MCDSEAPWMDVHRAVTAAWTTSPSEIRQAYRRALAHGAGHTRCTPEQERTHAALRLLTLATLRASDLVLYAHLLHVYTGEPRTEEALRPVAQALSDTGAGMLRLAHRALETHGRDAGHDPGLWIDLAREHAARELSEHTDRLRVPLVLEQARLAAVSLTRATASANDRTLRPDQVAAGLVHLLVVYLIATEAITS